MNYTETFDQFASRLGPTDLALYAGAGIILWILFKDKLSPVQAFLVGLFNRTKTDLKVPNVNPEAISVKTESILDGLFGRQNSTGSVTVTNSKSEDNFFNLVVSWKQTRDLAVKSGCSKAVEVADQMFPFLSPQVCAEKDITNE